MNTNISVKPNAMSTLDAWLFYLEQLHPKTIELGLERVAKVASRLNVLKPAPYVFTVAGTNGKGTTCRALEMILLTAGFKVGVYSSPHLLRYTERVRINNQEVADDFHVKAFDQIEHCRQDISLTYFEYATLSALLLFKQADLDVVILEVGLGGRLDATNIVNADVAVITSIALDHMDYLGNTRDSIGREKAGIFKENCIAIVGEPDMPQSIYNFAIEKNAQLHCCQPNYNYDWQYQQINQQFWQFESSQSSYEALPIAKIPLANAATALAALSYSSLEINEDSIRRGLMKTELTGRFQTIGHDPIIIVDVAHNPHAAAYLHKQLQALIANKPAAKKLRMVIGMLKDKDIASTMQILQADAWYCASLYGERGASAEYIAANIVKNTHSPIYTFPSVSEALAQAQYDADKNDIIIVCGSFHTVSEALSLVENE
ncbi:bifunctional tetrahydrofolate synthase/dihydrofolate synthase [Orbus sturtevantii]|uniref:bifunctional tetrahydrofolate synthase/dihydrofolate synthase n=1 Tax=Orbus sturtevantii TaxID=3074109 RepID=UPI00370D7D34